MKLARSSLVLPLLLAGCWPYMHSKPCLSGRPPQIGRPVPDAMYTLFRRELARAEDPQRSAVVRAAILETVPSLIPVTNVNVEPACAPELRVRLHRQLKRRPLPYTRLTLARLQSLANLGDTSDVMDHKGSSLLALAQLPDDAIAPYTLSPGEAGAPPPRALFRQRALAALVGSNLFLNVPPVRQFLTERVWQSRDDREQLLLLGISGLLLQGSLRGHVTRPADDEAPSLLRAWIADTRTRLAQPGDRVSFELARARLPIIGGYAVVFGLAAPARALLQSVLDAHGELPLAHAAEAGAVDLALAARAGLYDIEVPFDHLFHLDEPAGESAPFDAWREWIRPAPTTVHFSDDERATRTRELDDELPRTSFTRPRCHVLAQLQEWAPASTAERRYDELLAPIFDGARLHFSGEVMCRLSLALDAEAVPVARRIELALRLLRTPASDIDDYDDSGNEHDPFYVRGSSKRNVRYVALGGVARHPRWLDESAALRQWLAARAVVADDPEDTGRLPELQATLFARLLVWDAVHDGAQGRQMVAAWIEQLRDTSGAQLFARLEAIGRFAGDFGLVDAARSGLRQLVAERQAAPPSHGVPDRVLRVATLALYRVDWRAERPRAP